MPQKPPRSPRFTILFVLVLLTVSALVFLAFTRYQRDMADARRKGSTLNLLRLEMLLEDFANGHAGQYPKHAAALFERGGAELDLIHPSWPEQPGYIFVTGVRTVTDERDAIVIYENVPERKRKLGYQVLRLNGKVESLSQEEFMQAIGRQEQRWKSTGRVWQSEEIVRPH